MDSTERMEAALQKKGIELFRELKRIYETVDFDDYYHKDNWGSKVGVWRDDLMRLDLQLLEAHRFEAGAPDPPPLEEVEVPEMPKVETAWGKITEGGTTRLSDGVAEALAEKVAKIKAAAMRLGLTVPSTMAEGLNLAAQGSQGSSKAEGASTTNGSVSTTATASATASATSSTSASDSSKPISKPPSLITSATAASLASKWAAKFGNTSPSSTSIASTRAALGTAFGAATSIANATATGPGQPAAPSIVEQRLITLFVAKWKLDAEKTKSFMAALTPPRRRFVIQNFKGPEGALNSTDALEAYILECDLSNSWEMVAPLINPLVVAGAKSASPAGPPSLGGGGFKRPLESPAMKLAAASLAASSANNDSNKKPRFTIPGQQTGSPLGLSSLGNSSLGNSSLAGNSTAATLAQRFAAASPHDQVKLRNFMAMAMQKNKLG